MNLNINKSKIQEAFERGDIIGLDELQTQLKNNTNVDQDLLDLLTCLYELNFVLIETETKNYATKYNIQVQDLYSKIKSDLFDILEM